MESYIQKLIAAPKEKKMQVPMLTATSTTPLVGTQPSNGPATDSWYL